MAAEHLCVLLLAYFLAAAAGSILAAALGRGARWALAAAAALAALGLVTWIGTLLLPGVHYLEQVAGRLATRDRRTLVAAALGGSAGLAWLAAVPGRPGAGRGRPGAGRAGSRVGGALAAGLLLASIAGTALAGAVALLHGSGRFTATGALAGSLDPRFRLEPLARFEMLPVRVAADEGGRIFVSISQVDQGFNSGSIVEVAPGPDGGSTQRVAAESAHLFRPYGLQARGGHLYVSRSGLSSRARGGRVEFEPSGGVARLSDLDGDGRFEFFHDVAEGLPGSRDTHSQHGNNAVALGPDGRLYVAVGCASDRSPGTHPFEGTILRVDPEGGEPEVFARGLRNPFGLCFGPGGELFVVDQDADAGVGDKLLHVRRGDDFGHPYARPELDQEASGYRAPVLLSDPLSTFTAIAYAGPDAPLPPDLRDAFFVADSAGDRVEMIRLARRDDGRFEVAERRPIARASHPTDLALTPDGSLLILSYFGRTLDILRPAAR